MLFLVYKKNMLHWLSYNTSGFCGNAHFIIKEVSLKIICVTGNNQKPKS